MESGIPLGDIIVLGAVAAFIILRYRAMLGENRGRDPRDTEHDNDNEHADAEQGMASEKVIQLPRSARKKPEAVAEDAPKKDYSPAIADGLKDIANADKEFEDDAFLDGAKMAFEMVITAFNEQDKETLEMLLSKELYQNFADAIDGQKDTDEFSHTTLVALSDVRITRAAVEDKIAQVDVAFTSEQIQIVKDKDGAIIEGDASEQQVVEDEWRFARDTRSSRPDWKIIET